MRSVAIATLDYCPIHGLPLGFTVEADDLFTFVFDSALTISASQIVDTTRVGTDLSFLL